MGGLREQLVSWSIPQGLVFEKSIPKIETTANEVRLKLLNAEPAALNSEEFKKVWQTFNELKDNPKKFRTIPKRLLRRAPWVIFEEFESNVKPLIEDKSFTKNYLVRLKTDLDGRAITALVHAFLLHYPVNKPYFKPMQQIIPDLLSKCGSAILKSAKEQCLTHKLFETEGPSVFAAAVLAGKQPLSQLFSGAGLVGDLSYRGFVIHSYENALTYVRDNLKQGSLTEKMLQNFLSWAADNNSIPPTLRYPTHRTKLAESFLLPFVQIGGKSQLANTIQEYLLKLYGDPRTDRANWYGIDEDAVRVMMNWLVNDTLEDFFSLLDYSARDDEEASWHWKYRKAFWSAYLHRGYITDAWVVLGEDIRSIAVRDLKIDMERYAKFDGSGVKRNHAVLIMRIGDHIITEWNHMGKYRVWNVNTRHAPKMYKNAYTRYELVDRPDRDGSHFASGHGTWQEKLENYIRSQTGCSVPRKEYMAIR